MSSAAPAVSRSEPCRTDAGADFLPIVEIGQKSLDDPRDGEEPLQKLQRFAGDHAARTATRRRLVTPPSPRGAVRGGRLAGGGDARNLNVS